MPCSARVLVLLEYKRWPLSSKGLLLSVKKDQEMTFVKRVIIFKTDIVPKRVVIIFQTDIVKRVAIIFKNDIVM